MSIRGLLSFGYGTRRMMKVMDDGKVEWIHGCQRGIPMARYVLCTHPGKFLAASAGRGGV